MSEARCRWYPALCIDHDTRAWALVNTHFTKGQGSLSSHQHLCLATSCPGWCWMPGDSGRAPSRASRRSQCLAPSCWGIPHSSPVAGCVATRFGRASLPQAVERCARHPEHWQAASTRWASAGAHAAQHMRSAAHAHFRPRRALDFSCRSQCCKHLREASPASWGHPRAREVVAPLHRSSFSHSQAEEVCDATNAGLQLPRFLRACGRSPMHSHHSHCRFQTAISQPCCPGHPRRQVLRSVQQQSLQVGKVARFPLRANHQELAVRDWQATMHHQRCPCSSSLASDQTKSSHQACSDTTRSAASLVDCLPSRYHHPEFHQRGDAFPGPP
mmetsp:Transcript_131124/g.327155  ORF Transcript_131124/g.327155 Transcript_131124/m.327155 type:complete len:329 (+) Transcript_131124:141-1127(+)